MLFVIPPFLGFLSAAMLLAGFSGSIRKTRRARYYLEEGWMATSRSVGLVLTVVSLALCTFANFAAKRAFGGSAALAQLDGASTTVENLREILQDLWRPLEAHNVGIEVQQAYDKVDVDVRRSEQRARVLSELHGILLPGHFGQRFLVIDTGRFPRPTVPSLRASITVNSNERPLAFPRPQCTRLRTRYACSIRLLIPSDLQSGDHFVARIEYEIPGWMQTRPIASFYVHPRDYGVRALARYRATLTFPTALLQKMSFLRLAGDGGQLRWTNRPEESQVNYSSAPVSGRWTYVLEPLDGLKAPLVFLFTQGSYPSLEADRLVSRFAPRFLF